MDFTCVPIGSLALCWWSQSSQPPTDNLSRFPTEEGKFIH